MTEDTPKTAGKLIHAARFFKDRTGWVLLLLRKTADNSCIWFEETSDKQETQTSVSAANPEEALRLAFRQWQGQSFRTIRCGYRFTLPERDEIGTNALMHHMIASYSISNGIYFDDELGHQCIVKETSQEALDLWKSLASQKRLG